MRKGNLLLCGIVAVAMLAPSCQAIAPDVEYKRLPDWNCLEGLESYTEENGAIVPVLHVGGNWKCNFANQWGELLVEGVFDDFGEFSEGLALVRVGDTFGYIDTLATVYKGNIIKNLIMDCQSYAKYRPNETTGGIFVSWRRKEELPTGA